MKRILFNSVVLTYFIVSALIACTKENDIEPDGKIDTEVQDTTDKKDTLVEPEEIQLDSLNAGIRIINRGETGWKMSWVEDDAINVFSTDGESREQSAQWVNHGKFTFNPQTTRYFKGKINGELEQDKTYTYHAFYPYSASFKDPAGINNKDSDNLVKIGHMPGGYIVQHGNTNTDHLSEINMPMFSIATAKGTAMPKFNFMHMAAVFAVNVTNNSEEPLIVSDVTIEHSDEYIIGEFAVNIAYVNINSFDISYSIYRNPVNASNKVHLKVENPEPIPVGESAYFYLPILANSFWSDSELTITVNDFVRVKQITNVFYANAGKFEPLKVAYTGAADIELKSPAQGESINIAESGDVKFEWTQYEDRTEYTVLLSASADMSNPISFDATGSSLMITNDFFDHMMHDMGVDPLKSGKAYWTVTPRGDDRIVNISSFNVTRKNSIPYEERIADQITIPVAVLIEDPIVPSTGKRFTEMVHAGWGHRWYDPYVQMKEFERDMEFSSHNVVQYEIVKVVEADRLFSYYTNSVSLDEKEFMTIDTLVNYHFAKRVVDDISDYDYVGMMQHYGFDKMVDAGEIKEVWVYTHPASGMYESRLIGDGAFWCNSPGIGSYKATNKELCCVMFCNYERTTDLAMHSYAHRVESIMSQVYENRGGLYGWNYDTRSHDELTNWEKYSAYGVPFKKYKEGYSHIGCCHFPPNATADYQYESGTLIKSYADTWYDYPDIREYESIARSVNKSEWEDEGGYQWGYMKWYFGHLPHFKGLCPRDFHLNNWWYYIVDYNNAILYEQQLKRECIYF